MTTGVIVEGLEKVKPTLDAALEVVRARVAERMAALGEETAFIASGNAPHRTGALAQSIRARLTWGQTSLTETIRPGAFYGKILAIGVVNHGTRFNKSSAIIRSARAHRSDKLRQSGQWRIPPNPYMLDAETAMKDRVEQQLREATNEALAEVSK